MHTAADTLPHRRTASMRDHARPRANALLARLPPRARERLERLLSPVALRFGEILYDTKPIRHVYFPVDCVVALLAPLNDHPAVEVGLVGSEGMIGVPLALGVSTSCVQALVHGPGTALRMSASAFQDELHRNAALEAGIHQYIHLLMAQHTQTAACNAFHPIEARCARWLLMTRDRMQSDEMAFTQEFLARMLGVRRVGVTVAAGKLQERGVIAYSRGRIVICDPEKLAAAACECYGVVTSLYKTQA